MGIATSINFRIQGHTLTLVEVEGAHTLQESYESIDIHVGQSVAVLITCHASPKDYFVVASTRFTKPILTTTAILHYDGSHSPASLPLPVAPTYHIHWSMKQARTIRYIYILKIDEINLKEINCTSEITCILTVFNYIVCKERI